MKKLKLLLRLAAGWFALGATMPPAFAAIPPNYGVQFDSTTGRTNMYLSGRMYVAASSNTYSTPTITLDGVTGTVGLTSFSLSTLAISGNAFSVGGSTFVVTGGRVGVGTSTPATLLDVNGAAQFGSGTLKSSFTAAGALIASSASVTGNYFSVGGSSFTVVGGTATVAYRMTAASFSGDGSNLSNVGGGISLSANNSYTGNNTFTASVTANAGFFLDGSIALGWPVPIQSGSVTNVSTLTLTGLASSTTYRLVMDMTLVTGPSSAATPYLVFNQAGITPYSTTAVYYTAISGQYNGAGLSVQAGPIKYCALSEESANPMNTGDTTRLELSFSTVYGSSVAVRATTLVNATGAAADINKILVGETACYFRGGAPLTDVEIFWAAINEGAGGATWNGKYVLYKISGF